MHVRLLLWSLRQRRWRHVLNLLATAVTVGVVIVFVSMMLGILRFTRTFSEGQLERLMVAPKIESPVPPFADGLPPSLKPSLEQIAGVKVVQRKFILRGKHANGATYMVAGEEASGVELNKDIYPIEPALVEAWKNEKPMGALVTEATAAALNLTVGQTAEVPTTANKPLSIKVVGIVKGSIFPTVIAVHYDYLTEFAKAQTCGYRIFINPDQFAGVVDAIQEQTKNSATPAQAISSERLRARMAKNAGMIPAVLGFLGLFLVLTAALTLANNTGIAIRERRVEIATLRVLGYHAGTIVRLLVSEAVLVGLLGGIVAAAIVMFVFGDGFGFATKALPTAPVSPIAIGVGLLVAITIPMIGALPAAIASVRRPLVDGLRETA
jgi:ABC-type lipoprotein release transport system permease subunit